METQNKYTPEEKALADAMLKAKTGSFAPSVFLKEGSGTLNILSVERYTKTNKVTKVVEKTGVVFNAVIVEGTGHPVGEKVTVLLDWSGEEWQVERAMGKTRDYLFAIANETKESIARAAAKDGTNEADCFLELLTGATSAEQAARGHLVKYTASPVRRKKDGTIVKTKSGETILEVFFTPVAAEENSPEAVATRRANLEKNYAAAVEETAKKFNK